LVKVLRASFSDPVAHGMNLSATKASYSVAFGLGPYYHEAVINDMQNAWYSLLVDETTTYQNLQQFDMHVRYWSRSDDKIVRKYLSSAFLGHARADDLLKSITEIRCASKQYLQTLHCRNRGKRCCHINR